MKTRNALLMYGLIFVGLLGGVLILQTQADIAATATCMPPVISLEDPEPEMVKIILTLPKSYDHEDIDPSTLLVGGLVPMMEEEGWPKVKKSSFTFKVYGGHFMDWVIWPYIWHLSPGPAEWVDMDISVTGQLYDTTPFAGTFSLRIRTEANDNEPGIPPP